jgi:hypothetical protein
VEACNEIYTNYDSAALKQRFKLLIKWSIKNSLREKEENQMLKTVCINYTTNSIGDYRYK